jgi:hypothetical protein
MMAVFLLVPVYPFLQVVAFRRLRGLRWILVGLPVLVMVPAYGFSFYALSQAGSLWPLWIIFGSAPSCVYLGIVLFICRRKKVVVPPVIA